MTVAIGVVAHNARADQAHQLMEDAGAMFLSMDNGGLGVNNNHLNVWKYLANKDTEWGLVVEDDCDIDPTTFTHQLEQALNAASTPVVSLYLGDPSHWRAAYPDRANRITAAAQAADHTQACFIETKELLHGVATAIRTDHIAHMTSHVQHSSSPIDYAIRAWAVQHNVNLSFTWPSIVDHKDGPTLLKHPDGRPRLKQRKAFRVGTRNTWTSTSVTMRSE